MDGHKSQVFAGFCLKYLVIPSLLSNMTGFDGNRK